MIDLLLNLKLNKMKKFSLFLILCSVTVAASAQNFLLYSFKGNVSVVENKVESKAKVGKPLTGAASIKIASGGAVTLICNEAAMFTLSKPGTYALSSFGDSCRVSTGSVSSNYVKYVWASMTKTSGSAGSDRKTYMNTVGAVSRGGMNPVWIDYKLDTTFYSSGDFFLSWKVFTDAKDFEFQVYDPANLDKPVYKTVVNSKMKIAIPSFINNLTQGNTYYWTTIVKDQPVDDPDLKLLKYVSRTELDALINDLKAQGAAFEAPAEQEYRLGFLLEDKHFLAEAYTYYLKATTLDPANALYRSTLMSFKKDYEIK